MIRRLYERFRARGRGCHPACWNAHRRECECPCRGRNHASGHAPYGYVAPRGHEVRVIEPPRPPGYRKTETSTKYGKGNR